MRVSMARSSRPRLPSRARPFDARPHADREAEVIDRRERDLVVDLALDLVQQRLALLLVELPGLALEEVVHLRKRAGGERAARGDERLETRGRRAADAADRQHDA